MNFEGANQIATHYFDESTDTLWDLYRGKKTELIIVSVIPGGEGETRRWLSKEICLAVKRIIEKRNEDTRPDEEEDGEPVVTAEDVDTAQKKYPDMALTNFYAFVGFADGGIRAAMGNFHSYFTHGLLVGRFLKNKKCEVRVEVRDINQEERERIEAKIREQGQEPHPGQDPSANGA